MNNKLAYRRSLRFRRLLLVWCMALVSCVASLYAQEFSERKEIAIFRTNYAGVPRDPIPQSEATVQFGNIFSFSYRVSAETSVYFEQNVIALDQLIQSVFINLGRFDVIGVSHRLDHQNVTAFIEVLHDYREERVVLPETVLLGREPFLEEDFNSLVDSFIVVIPSITFYELIEVGTNVWDASLGINFAFVNVENLVTEEQFSIQATGTGDTPGQALSDARIGLAPQLDVRVRSVPAFQLRTGILEIAGDDVIIEFGRNRGVVVGDEFEIQRSQLLDIGRFSEDSIGLIKVKEVNADYSVGHLVYSTPEAVVGDQLVEIPRAGVEIAPYMQVMTNLAFNRWIPTIGMRFNADRGFFTLRPFFGLEVPLDATANTVTILPPNMYIGGDLNWYFGQLRLQPSIAIGFGSYILADSSTSEQFFAITHVGGKAQVALSLQLGRDVLVQLDTGYAQWLGLRSDRAETEREHRLLDSYGGIYAGLGINVKL